MTEVRSGRSQRVVAQAFGVSRATVQFWLQRVGEGRLDRVDWTDHSCSPHRTRRTAGDLEELVLTIRRELKEESVLGEFGAVAIHGEMLQRELAQIPSVRTIGRILERRGVLDHRARVRRPAPPRGWHLPDVAAGKAELDSFDVIEGLVIEGGIHVEILNGISLHGGLVASWPLPAVTAEAAGEAMAEHWREVGLPTYAQFDNDTRFQGPHNRPDVVGRVIRFCLSLGVVPVFAPPREHGFQADIESFNGRWQQKVWSRFHHVSLCDLRDRSGRYVAALRARTVSRREAAPERRPLPPEWCLDLRAPLRGHLIFLRRTTERGQAQLLGRTFDVTPTWPHRLVRAEVDLEQDVIRFYALRRRDPLSQPLLREVRYRHPHRRSTE